MPVALSLVIIASTTRVSVRSATDVSELWAASRLLATSFADNSPVSTPWRLCTLRYPALEANVFFDVAGDPAIGIAQADGGEVVGCAQLIPARMKSPYAANTPPTVAFVQNLAVAQPCRRSGIGRSLMEWCEAAAADAGLQELWLAAAEDRPEVGAFHASLGYEQAAAAAGNRLLRKRTPVGGATLPSSSANSSPSSRKAVQAADGKTEPAARSDEGICFTALATEMGVQLMYALVASAGISLLIAPLGGRGLDALCAIAPPGASWVPATADGAIGLVSAACILGLRRDEWLAEPSAPMTSAASDDDDVSERILEQSAVAQLAPAARILRSETRSASIVAAVCAWQLPIAVAEELYYRGLVQNGLQGALAAGLSTLAGAGEAGMGLGATALAEGLALAVSSLLFAIVHTAWVDEVSACMPDAPPVVELEEAKRRWLVESGGASLVFGALFIATSHTLFAPIACHAALNIVPTSARELRQRRQRGSSGGSATLQATAAGSVDD